MLSLPIIGLGAVALGGATYVCAKGITVEKGSVADLQWRVRFACWRYIAEVNMAGVWKRAGIFPLSGKLNAVQLAMSTANAEAFSPKIMARAKPQVRIIRATKA